MSEPSTDDASARRGHLIGLKLRALVRDHLGDDTVVEASSFHPGAALRHGEEAWVLLDDRPGVRLGASLAWALRSGARSLHVLAEHDVGLLARRAAEFSMSVSVWTIEGRSLSQASPEPALPSGPAPASHESFRALIADGGATPVVEHGVLFGEVRGLEVCRVVDDVHLGVTRLEVGVGAHDREAFQMLHGDVPAVDSLARITATVAEQRVPGAPQHPLNRLAAERLIRWRLEQRPELVSALDLAPAPPPVPRANLKDAIPCVAAGTGTDGATVIVVCASGVDLDVIPYAADARLAARGAAAPGADIRLVVAMPSRDQIRVTDEIAGLLVQPAEFVSVD